MVPRHWRCRIVLPSRHPAVADLSAVPIVALDVPSEHEAMALVRELGPLAGWYKVGGELFTACGPSVVRAIRASGRQVFLDLKFHDIPNTVRASARSAAGLGASMITVHASGGATMVRAAVEGAGPTCHVMGVTVLTSMDAPSLAETWGRVESGVELLGEVVRLAGICAGAGTHGVVCSGHEASAIVERFSGLNPLVPGIRFAEGSSHDQVRVMTPRRAVEVGARYLVLGRAVTAAPDPRSAMQRVLDDIRAT
ncbi:MAG: orotidine-5'-phosphate decarboxylase [Gemmatimonadaceae bacterium]|nr:orotidine-5'-phosphate decarboxylase [Gemmatimonadaceae bacterium]